MHKYPIKPQALTGWASTDARITVGCPKCNASKGFYCVTPVGRKAAQNHMERGAAYLQFIGREEFDRRHSVAATPFV
jgi:hypothetical protein